MSDFNSYRTWSSGDTPLPTDSLSPGMTTNNHFWHFDALAQDPSYIAYQEELRDLIFLTATHAAPTLTGSPELALLDTTSNETVSPPTFVPPFTDGQDAATHLNPNTFSLASDRPSFNRDRPAAAVLSHGRRFEYLQNYVGQVAPWLDMFDSRHRVFGVEIPLLAHRSSALLYAILALSARQKERLQSLRAADGSRDSGSLGKRKTAPEAAGNSGTAAASAPSEVAGAAGTATSSTSSTIHTSPTYADSLELYQEAICLLRPLLQAHDPLSVPICTVLCVLEMMSASAQDWRRHLEGCAALFDAFRVHGFSGGLSQAVFWCYARMDLCGALISDGCQSTHVPPAKWLGPGADADEAPSLFRQVDGGGSPDAHANYAVYLCACVCELLADRTRFEELGSEAGLGCCDDVAFSRRWSLLWERLQVWFDKRGPAMRPIEVVETQPFPQVLFTHWAAISANQLYHTACILLLQSRPLAGAVANSVGSSLATVAPSSTPSLTGVIASAPWHARRICGISLTNPHEGCLNNAIQPLWIAGRLLSHRAEHTVIVKLIRSIEAMTGWAACWRIADLEVAWGYRPNGLGVG
ncbi:hypothetical protein SEUCBS140593_002737 [Sporothrix eucalyptigena]|uniref:C6 zinc finger domain containing protein n=1 Tax=Sporothrix eucalyptigena TaxID=1812306 RepID=A0ABP0B8Z4_9PEZI